AVTQSVRETNDRRRLNLGPLGDLRDRAEGHISWMVERKLGDQPEAVGKARIAMRDLLPQRIICAEWRRFPAQSCALGRLSHKCSVFSADVRLFHFTRRIE